MMSMTIHGNSYEQEGRVSEGCPICERLWDAQLDILAQLQCSVGKEEENYLERNGLYAICGKHLRMFDSITSSQISSKLLGYLIKRALCEYGTSDGEDIFRECEQMCPVCRYLQSVEMEEIRRMAKGRCGQLTGEFVCADHLKGILSATLPENGGRILNAYGKSLEVLRDQLKVLESGSYHQIPGEMKSSLWRAVKKLTGRK